MTSTARIVALIFAAAIVGQSGCGRDSADGVYPVRGRVLFQGKPTVHAQVTLHPVGTSGRDAVHPVGEVDDQGYFTLTSVHKGDGAAPGEYRVTVSWYLARPVRPNSDETSTTNYLPARYSRADTSGLTAVVTPGNNELPTFELK
jgi:hypothetical protein